MSYTEMVLKARTIGSLPIPKDSNEWTCEELWEMLNVSNYDISIVKASYKHQHGGKYYVWMKTKSDEQLYDPLSPYFETPQEALLWAAMVGQRRLWNLKTKKFEKIRH